jgi:hypothetical protein
VKSNKSGCLSRKSYFQSSKIIFHNILNILIARLIMVDIFCGKDLMILLQIIM